MTDQLLNIITGANGVDYNSRAETLDKYADRLGRELKEMGLKTSQVRPLLGEIRHIQTQWILSQPATVKRGAVLQRMLLLKPKMVYLSRRERHRAVSRLVTELDNALNYVLKAPQVEQDSCMKYFVDFLEAVLTYLKAYGGS